MNDELKKLLLNLLLVDLVIVVYAIVHYMGVYGPIKVGGL